LEYNITHATQMTKLELQQDLLKACDIGHKIIRQSNYVDEKTKAAFLAYASIKGIVENLSPTNGLTLYSLNILGTEILTYWNENIGLDTELFWSEMRASGSRIERKDPLVFALNKKRFRNVEQGMSARKSWEELKISDSITQRFSSMEIATLDQIIKADENNRLHILKKCLLKNKIPPTQYLKFGECWAYFANCKLFEMHFTAGEVSELYRIWMDFK